MRLFTFTLVAAAIFAGGCSSSAQKGAGQGATLGAVGGAVAGAVGSLIFGGNPLQGAVQGAAIGAASGAATGAVAGSMSDKAAKERTEKAAAGDPKLAELRKKIGDKNYSSALLLAQCRHKDAIASAQETVAVSTDPNEKGYALLLQGVAAEESGDKALATSLYPKIAQQNGGSVDKARADSLEAMIKVQAVRREHGLPACK
jgi:hypothetical protein